MFQLLPWRSEGKEGDAGAGVGIDGKGGGDRLLPKILSALKKRRKEKRKKGSDGNADRFPTCARKRRRRSPPSRTALSTVSS